MAEIGKTRRTSRWLTVIPAVIAIGVLAGCASGSFTSSGGASGGSGGGSATTPAASASTGAGTAPAAAGPCSPSGSSLTISAKNIKFDKSCLAAPANTAFTITFDNEDSGVPHDVAIYTNSSASKSLFKGAIVTGPKTMTYHVPALPVGKYYFRCDIHPTQMNGTFVVG